MNDDKPRRWYSENGKGSGRLDVNGVEWFMCDPYGTWYRWEGTTLLQPDSIEWADGLGNRPTEDQINELP